MKNVTYIISGDITTSGSSGILRIVCEDIAGNVQGCVGTAGAEKCAGEVKGFTIGVIVA